MKLPIPETNASLSDRFTALKYGNREALLSAARSWLDCEQQKIRERFFADGNANILLASHTQVIDTLIAALFDVCRQGEAAGLALVAVGGYGRGELFPYSDIDVLFLHEDSKEQKAGQVAELLLYLLWDLGLTVGQAHRSLDGAIVLSKQDITIRTNLLDARFVAGDETIFTQFTLRFEQEVVSGSTPEFIEKKLMERDERHRRFGDSRYVLEPNIKEGKGGLRDLHTLWWLARYAYPIRDLKELIPMGLLTREEYRLVAHARDFLYKLRAHLHYMAGRAEERLNFDRQYALAAVMGYHHCEPHHAVERFMRRYFSAARSVGTATRIFCALLEEEKKRPPHKRLAWKRTPWMLGKFRLEGERLTIRKPQAFERQPALMLELFRMGQLHGLDIHPRTLQMVTRNLRRIDHRLRANSRAAALFMDILLSPVDAETTLRKMSEAGVLGQFIPEFGRVIGQTQFNMYHIYTVDEHTLVAIGMLHAIENGTLKEELPLASDIIRRIKLRRVLYLALFCHDIAKGRSGDHSEQGSAIALKLAQNFGLSRDEAETAAWLVKHHLLFSHTALRRDLSDPKTIQDFVDIVQSSERLKLLLVLTVADMRATGSSVWNAWKASLIEELYTRAEHLMGVGTAMTEEGTEMLALALHKQLAGWQASEIEAYLAQATPAFLVGLNLARHAVVARMLKQAQEKSQPLFIDTHHNYERQTTEIIVVAADQTGVFSKIAGAMTLAGANITHAKIFTLKNGMVVDIFQVQDAAADVFDRPDRLAKMSVYVEQALSNELDLTTVFKKRQELGALKVSGQVFIENDASALHTVIEITGQDRSGFLYQISHAMTELGLSIHSAHISTYGTQVADVFYVKDLFGMKIIHPQKIKNIREALLNIVQTH